MKVQFSLGRKFSPEQHAKIMRARDLLEQVINSDDFAVGVVNFERKELECVRTGWFRKSCKYVHAGFGFEYDGNGRTETDGARVLEIIRSGAETLSPEADGEADINIDLGYGRAVGYTYPNSAWQWINQWFLDSSNVTEADIAGNIAHEYMHKLGFGHAYRSHATRQYTVCYAIGYLVAGLAKKRLALAS